MTEHRQLHLNLNLLNAGVYGGAWRHPASDPAAFADPAFYVHYARLCEQAKLDAVFLADGAVLEPLARYRPFQSLEPTIVLATIAAATQRIGLIGTASTSYNDPYNLARRLLTLDRVSGERAQVNKMTPTLAKRSCRTACVNWRFRTPSSSTSASRTARSSTPTA